MAKGYDTISFMSDYGHTDEFVGVCKSVIRSISPKTTVIDISHDIPPFDVKAAALTLCRTSQYLVPGVVLAVVDPGVGTDRWPIAVVVGDDAESILVGPDNGLLAGVVGMVGGAKRVVEIKNPAYMLTAPGFTFGGRDVFAPAAAHICNGVDLSELGPDLDPAVLVPSIIPVVHEEKDGLHAEVLWVDRYGNAQLNIDPDDIEVWGPTLAVRVGGKKRTARLCRAYAELKTAELGLVVDSYGMISLSMYQSSAANEFDIGPGAPVIISRIGGSELRLIDGDSIS